MAGAELFTAHELAHRFLGRVFSAPPSSELVRRLVEDDLLSDWPLPSGGDEARTGLALLHGFCRSPGAAELAPLRADYGRLFEVPGDGFVRPWESVYRSEDHLLFEPVTDEVGEVYRRFGVAAPDAEPADHLGLELGFVAHLLGLASAAVERGEAAALREVTVGLRSFLRDHLEAWAGDCLRQVVANARTPFYRGAAHLALGCIAETSRAVEVAEGELA